MKRLAALYLLTGSLLILLPLALSSPPRPFSALFILLATIDAGIGLSLLTGLSHHRLPQL